MKTQKKYKKNIFILEHKYNKNGRKIKEISAENYCFFCYCFLLPNILILNFSYWFSANTSNI